MKLSLFKSLSLGLLTTAAMSFSVTHAAKQQDENIEVTPIQKVTQQELAAIYVLSEVCPSLVKDDAQFSKGYSKLAHEYLPQEKDAVSALNKLSKEKKFKSILAEARSDAKNAGDAKNKEICQELTAYSK
ncbi:MCR_0457 family protein [Acinetobacter sp. TSRC1-2]|uniref:MCR_0457 family protein n=1 Tax=unclassified Acinetobacter TaxID=196816 RepID=UPI003CF6F8B0